MNPEQYHDEDTFTMLKCFWHVVYKCHNLECFLRGSILLSWIHLFLCIVHCLARTRALFTASEVTKNFTKFSKKTKIVMAIAKIFSQKCSENFIKITKISQMISVFQKFVEFFAKISFLFRDIPIFTAVYLSLVDSFDFFFFFFLIFSSSPLKKFINIEKKKKKGFFFLIKILHAPSEMLITSRVCQKKDKKTTK